MSKQLEVSAAAKYSSWRKRRINGSSMWRIGVASQRDQWLIGMSAMTVWWRRGINGNQKA